MVEFGHDLRARDTVAGDDDFRVGAQPGDTRGFGCGPGIDAEGFRTGHAVEHKCVRARAAIDDVPAARASGLCPGIISRAGLAIVVAGSAVDRLHPPTPKPRLRTRAAPVTAPIVFFSATAR